MLYTSTVAPAYPLQVDTSLNTVYAGVYNVVISGARLTASAVNYVFQDVQGSTRAVMSGTNVIARHDFQPFGEEIAPGIGLRNSGQGFSLPDKIRQRYALTERDDATGLDHTWWRKYENRSGRWTSPDPYGGSMSIANPQSFNGYAYVQNDPVNFVDPSGLKFMLACTIGNDCISTYTWASRYDEFEAFLRWIHSKEMGGIGEPLLRGGRGPLGQNPAQPQGGTGAQTQASDCRYIRGNLLGDPRNRSALNAAWTGSQAGTSSAHEVGGLLGQVIDEGQPYQRDIAINQSYTAPSTSPAGALQGFTNWAQGQISSNRNTVAFGYWYHTHPFNQGTPVANNPGYVYGNPNVPSGNDASVSATLALRGIAVSRTRIVVFDSSGNILCRFRR